MSVVSDIAEGATVETKASHIKVSYLNDSCYTVPFYHLELNSVPNKEHLIAPYL